MSARVPWYRRWGVAGAVQRENTRVLTKLGVVSPPLPPRPRSVHARPSHPTPPARACVHANRSDKLVGVVRVSSTAARRNGVDGEDVVPNIASP